MSAFKKGKNPKRPKLITIFGFLLILEAIELFALGVFHFSMNQGSELFSSLFAQWLTGRTQVTFESIKIFMRQLIANADSQLLLIALIESTILFFLTILALWSAIGFFRLWRIAWTSAMFVQGASLLISLILYFLSKPIHITFLMSSGIFMVLYLNYADIQNYFQVRKSWTAEDATYE
ncbi:MAG: hypothetical protein MUO76_14460 [Anaerolineaceae bacterium]|nr:hypothetical protein [Anaerolineaceae bacterium]